MDKKVEFFFYLGAVICFGVAAAGTSWKLGRLGRRGLAPQVVLVPLGLALWVFPLMWTTGKIAF